MRLAQNNSSCAEFVQFISSQFLTNEHNVAALRQNIHTARCFSQNISAHNAQEPIKQTMLYRFFFVLITQRLTFIYKYSIMIVVLQFCDKTVLDLFYKPIENQQFRGVSQNARHYFRRCIDFYEHEESI